MARRNNLVFPFFFSEGSCQGGCLLCRCWWGWLQDDLLQLKECATDVRAWSRTRCILILDRHCCLLGLLTLSMHRWLCCNVGGQNLLNPDCFKLLSISLEFLPLHVAIHLTMVFCLSAPTPCWSLSPVLSHQNRGLSIWSSNESCSPSINEPQPPPTPPPPPIRYPP